MRLCPLCKGPYKVFARHKDRAKCILRAMSLFSKHGRSVARSWYRSCETLFAHKPFYSRPSSVFQEWVITKYIFTIIFTIKENFNGWDHFLFLSVLEIFDLLRKFFLNSLGVEVQGHNSVPFKVDLTKFGTLYSRLTKMVFGEISWTYLVLKFLLYQLNNFQSWTATLLQETFRPTPNTWWRITRTQFSAL